ncbi:MAG: energy transducer TonB [Ignavibacteria bacterium]
MKSAPATEAWRDPFAPSGSWRIGAAVAVHAALVVAVIGLAATPEVSTTTRDLIVRLIQADAPVPQKPLPAIAPVQPKMARTPAPPPPVMTAAAESPAPASFAVAPQPTRAQPDSAPAPLPVTGARYDADYLHNPKPVYPMFSRRNGEEGKVQLRVRVSADGVPLEVEIKQSSGFARLDAAAREAVQKWRFVPARRGSEAIESWVGVPIVFSLEQ